MKIRLLSLLVFLAFAACKKEDKCENVICLNGGTCDNGTCICINGFSGQLCETAPDPCAGITCLNGGTCANGVCNCPTGYTGGNCSQQQTPEYVEITAVNLNQFIPQSWDIDGSGPDVYFKIFLNGTQLFENSANRVNNVSNGTVTTWNLPASTNLNLYEPTSQYVIEFYDWESFGADTKMASLYFTPYWDNNGFPSELIYNEINCSTCDAYFSFKVNYHF